MLEYGVEMRVPDTVKKPDELFTSGTPDVFGTVGRPRRPPTGRQVGHRGRRAAVRADVVVRLALLGVPARDPVDPHGRPGCPADVRLVAARHRRGVPRGLRGAPLRAVPHRPARPHRHVLGAAGVLRPAHRPRPLPGPARGEGRVACRLRQLATGTGPWLGWRPWRWVAGISLGLCRGHQVVRAVLPRGLRPDDRVVGHGGAPGGGGAALVHRCGAARRAVGRRGHGGPDRRHLPRVVGRLVPVRQRLRPAVGRRAPVARPRLGARRAAVPVALPPGDPHLPPHARTTTTPTGPTRGRGSSRAGRRRSSTRGPSGARTAARSPSAPRRSARSAPCRSGGWAPWRSSCWSFYWLFKRDWRAGGILAGLAGGYLPWFVLEERTIYSFYTVAFEPWVVLAVVFVLGLVLGDAPTRGGAAGSGCTSSGAYCLLTLAIFAFFWPIYTAQVIPQGQWSLRMWFPSWV